MRFKNQNNLVMIADDDLFVRKVLRTALQDSAQIVEVTDGADVVSVYKENMPDIIFLDIHLPNISGMDIIRDLLKVDTGAHIIMLSADSTHDNVRNSKLRGARGFLTKPFDKKRIIQLFNACPTVKFLDS